MHSDIFDNVEQYQFYQDEIGKLHLRIIKKSSYTSRDEKNIINEFKLKLQDKVDLIIDYVTEIERTDRGKHKFLIQKINLE